ncbi:MAG: hypothetical protein AB1Z98_18930 [Nannocystaceae bacterium]
MLALALAGTSTACFNPPATDDGTTTSGPGTTTTEGETTEAPPSTSSGMVTDSDPSTSSGVDTADSSTGEPAVCGDGIVQGGEACDDEGESESCNADCTAAACGDAIVNVTAGETCDDGGESASCNADCTAAACGDGVTNETAGEQCDDGTGSNEDECLDGPGGSCQLATCGDGFVWAGMELCDDGNGVQTDDCPDGPGASCLPALCGDGFVWAGMEQCDDGTGCGIDGWTVDLGMPPASTSWAVYTAAPASQSYTAVALAGSIYGTDGNQTTPYPTSELENSATQSPLTLIPASLDFESWHVDEGTGVDNKTFSISIDGGTTFTTVMDCSDAVTNPAPGYPMCQSFNQQRASGDWDAVSIPVPPALVGQLGIIRIDYDTLDSCCSFEQGWYMRNANFFSICP